jgi:hypothetical protein
VDVLGSGGVPPLLGLLVHLWASWLMACPCSNYHRGSLSFIGGMGRVLVDETQLSRFVLMFIFQGYLIFSVVGGLISVKLGVKCEVSRYGNRGDGAN